MYVSNCICMMLLKQLLNVFLCSPKGEAYSRCFVCLSLRPVPCLANNFNPQIYCVVIDMYIYIHVCTNAICLIK